jgi:tetratricopeptide (TPR) repeat protein
MLRVIIGLAAAATVMLIVAAAFFCDRGEVGRIDREGMSHFRAGDYATALGAWRKGLERFPDSPTLHYRVGTTLAVRGEFREAEQHLERAVELAPDDAEMRRELALCYFQDNRLDDAERELKRVLARADWFPEAHFFLGLIYETRHQRDIALDEYIRELNVNPACTYAWAKIQTWEKTATDRP